MDREIVLIILGEDDRQTLEEHLITLRRICTQIRTAHTSHEDVCSYLDLETFSPMLIKNIHAYIDYLKTKLDTKYKNDFSNNQVDYVRNYLVKFLEPLDDMSSAIRNKSNVLLNTHSGIILKLLSEYN